MSFATTTCANAYNNLNGDTPVMPAAGAISRQRTPTPHSTKQDNPPPPSGDKPTSDFPPPSPDVDLLLPDIESPLNMSDSRPPFPARGRSRTRSSSRRFPPPSSRPQFQSNSASVSSSNSMIYPHASPTVESHPQYLHYPPPQPHYSPHTGYVSPYASQHMISAPAYAYSLHSPIDMQGAMGHSTYVHSQQQDPSSNPLSPRPSFSQHGHIPPGFGHQSSPPPPVSSAPPHFSNTPGYHAMSYSSQPHTHYGYPSPQSYPNSGYQQAYLQPSFHSPYQSEQDNQWWYPRRFEGPQYLHQQPYHMPYQPQRQQVPAERYLQQQSQSGISSDAQLRSPRVSQPPARITPTQSPPQPSAPTSPPPKPSSPKPGPPVQSPPQITGREPVRQSYHPNPPPQRSEWVMWAGNVPSDATNEELWNFFNEPPEPSGEAREENAGVSSVFLIARSNCAFVNFDTEAHLSAAIARFSGQKIRPDDPKCPNLVCRVRKKTDDLRAGVGGQRGVGLHTKWIQERKQKAKMGGRSPVDDMIQSASNLSLTSDEESAGGGEGNRSFEQSSGSGSFASTTSSILTQYFPKRYFILKSLTQYDLDLSVEKGYWATQRHNEVILDQAYRTSTDVYLIFGVNKSGEFYGYARMAGPILQSDTKVAWASRNNSPTSTRVERTNTTQSATSPDTLSPRIILPLAEHRFADSSPSPFPSPGPALGSNSYNQPPFSVPDGVIPHDGPFDIDGMYIPGMSNHVDGLRTPNRETLSAPAELHRLHRKITMDTPEPEFSEGAILGHEYRNQPSSKMRTRSTPVRKHVAPFQPAVSTRQAIGEQDYQESREFHLDANAPIRALKHPPVSASTGARGQFGSSPMGTIEEQREHSGTPETPLRTAKKAEPPGVIDGEQPERAPSPFQTEGTNDKRADELPTWGEPFRMQWIRTERLPFYRTRHLRNPWNHDREVKVSRDGTELEPSVGQALLDEWDRVAEAPSTERQPQQPGQGGTGGGSRQQGRGKGGAGGGVQRGKK